MVFMEKVNNNNENKEKANDNENTQINSETKQKPDELLTSPLRKENKEKEEDEEKKEFDQMIQQLREQKEHERERYRRYLTLGRILWDIGSVFTIYGAFSSTIAGYAAFSSAIAGQIHDLSLSLFEVGFAIYIVGLVMAVLGRRIREKGDDWS